MDTSSSLDASRDMEDSCSYGLRVSSFNSPLSLITYTLDVCIHFLLVVCSYFYCSRELHLGKSDSEGGCMLLD